MDRKLDNEMKLAVKLYKGYINPKPDIYQVALAPQNIAWAVDPAYPTMPEDVTTVQFSKSDIENLIKKKLKELKKKLKF